MITQSGPAPTIERSHAPHGDGFAVARGVRRAGGIDRARESRFPICRSGGLGGTRGGIGRGRAGAGFSRRASVPGWSFGGGAHRSPGRRQGSATVRHEMKVDEIARDGSVTSFREPATVGCGAVLAMGARHGYAKLRRSNPGWKFFSRKELTGGAWFS